MKGIMLLLLALSAISEAQTLNYSYDQAGRLVSVAYPNGKTLTYAYDANGNLLRRVVASAIAGPTPASSAAGVVNAASELGGAVSPGELVAIYGAGIGPATLANYSLTPANYFDNLIANTTVLFDGIPAPLIFASSGLTAAVVPYSVAGQTSTQMVVNYQGRQSAAVTVPVTGSAPGLFSANGTGTGNGAILNQDTTVNSATNPAVRGSVIVLYGTGEGQTNPFGVDGRIALSVYPKPLLNVTVTIGGIPASVAYAGAAPYLVAGVFQINATIPAGVPSGPVPVVVKIGSASTQSGLTVSVQ